jgi:hypothetical protein
VRNVPGEHSAAAECAAPTDSKQMTYPVQIAVLASLYVAGGWIGPTLDLDHEHVSIIWPPSGLSLAALILFGRRL